MRNTRETVATRIDKEKAEILKQLANLNQRTIADTLRILVNLALKQLELINEEIPELKKP